MEQISEGNQEQCWLVNFVDGFDDILYFYPIKIDGKEAQQNNSLLK
ncbi:MAG: hypothetical protein ABH822_01995 [Patescibacteria group bacterium]